MAVFLVYCLIKLFQRSSNLIDYPGVVDQRKIQQRFTFKVRGGTFSQSLVFRAFSDVMVITYEVLKSDFQKCSSPHFEQCNVRTKMQDCTESKSWVGFCSFTLGMTCTLAYSRRVYHQVASLKTFEQCNRLFMSLTRYVKILYILQILIFYGFQFTFHAF